METARLEVSTQQHLERMQETAKVHYVQYGKSTKSKKGKIQVENSTKDLNCHQTPATDVGKEDTKRHRTAKLWKQCAEGVERNNIMRKFA